MDEDTQEAAEHQQSMDEQRGREDMLLARAPRVHAELELIAQQTRSTVAAILHAVDRIFRA